MNNLESAWSVRDGDVVLLASRCARCSATQFPATEICPACGPGTQLVSVALSGEGKLYAFTELYQSKPEFPTPYYIGYVDLPEGVRVPGRLVNDTGRPLKSGLEVRLGRGRIGSERGGEARESYVFCVAAQEDGLSGDRDE